MDQDEKAKFNKLFSETLTYSGIEHAYGVDGEAYVVYNENGILFTVTFYTTKHKYVFSCTNLFKSQYQKYGLPAEAIPSPAMAYETVAFAYKTQQLVRRARKDCSVIYKDLLFDSDIEFEMRGNFETYVVYNTGIASYAIGYDPKTRTHGFKRYELVKTLYKICGIPFDKKPDYATLFQHTRDKYMAQEALYNMQHLYD